MSKSKSKGAAWREAGAATKPGGGLAIASGWPVHEVLLSRGWPVKIVFTSLEYAARLGSTPDPIYPQAAHLLSGAEPDDIQERLDHATRHWSV
jgi:hypothetical protein